MTLIGNLRVLHESIKQDRKKIYIHIFRVCISVMFFSGPETTVCHYFRMQGGFGGEDSFLQLLRPVGPSHCGESK